MSTLAPSFLIGSSSYLQDFFYNENIYIISDDFSRPSRAANYAVLGPIWPNFELVRDAMDVLVTCKYEEDPIKMKALEC